jgi:putative exosortase-associated protein (TIGR04073 family)
MRASKIVVFALAIVAVTATGFPRGPFYGESIPARSSRKFTRGVMNTVFFWVEIPKEVNRDWQNVDPMTGVFTGTGRGFYKGAQRFGAGIYEIVTFPLDVPANYQPLVYPETVAEDGYDWGAEDYYRDQRVSKIDH